MQYPHHVYLDLYVINNNHTPGGSPPYLRSKEIKNMHALDGDSSEYFCSIVRFTMQTSNTLPVLIPSVRVGQDHPKKTIYTVSLTYTHKGVNYISTNSATYVPEDKNGSDSCPAVVEARLLKQILLCIQLLAFRRIGEFRFPSNLCRLSQSSASGRRKPIVRNCRSLFRF